MDKAKPTYTTIDAYIQQYPEAVQEKLQVIRECIKNEVPEATETISYGVPTFKLNGTYVIFFAGFKNHISLYPIISEDEASVKEIAKYRTGKGTVQFPLDKPLPLPLIHKIIVLRVKDNKARTAKK